MQLQACDLFRFTNWFGSEAKWFFTEPKLSFSPNPKFAKSIINVRKYNKIYLFASLPVHPRAPATFWDTRLKLVENLVLAKLAF
jgi:hypothetical protein